MPSQARPSQRSDNSRRISSRTMIVSMRMHCAKLRLGYEISSWRYSNVDVRERSYILSRRRSACFSSSTGETSPVACSCVTGGGKGQGPAPAGETARREQVEAGEREEALLRASEKRLGYLEQRTKKLPRTNSKVSQSQLPHALSADPGGVKGGESRGGSDGN
eukprot:677073-Hanusia_phi.AAC.3